MPRIRCHYEDCVFLENGFCSAERVEIDPELGCLTFQQPDEATPAVAEWEEEEPEALFEEDDEEEEEVEWEDDEDDEEDEDEW